jgi:mono/diheme cytochrome c family protein
MRYAVLLLASAVLAASGPAIVTAQEAGDVRAGRLVAQKTCAACHAVEGGQARSPNPDAPSFTAIAAVPGMTTAAMLAALQTSHRERTMPNLILPPDELRDVVAYVLSLK